MSEALTPEAPAITEAVETPSPEAAANVGSVDSPSVIPTERFNGLMSKYNADKQAWDLERESMRTQLESLETQAVSEPDMSEDVLSELRELRAELQQEKLNSARSAAIAQFPGAAPLADLIVGDSPAAITAMAQELHERLATLAAAQGTPPVGASESSTISPADPAAAPAVPVVGGVVTVDDSAGTDEAISTALGNKDFSAFLRAAAQRADSENVDLTVG